MNLSQKRLQKELETIQNDPIPLTYISPKNDNLSEWEGYIIGPGDTPYENGKFRLLILIPDRYPMDPPTVTFVTKMFHPNISVDGKICVDILKNKWLPSMTLQKILISILSMLSEPNPHDPLNERAGNIYNTNYNEFKLIVKKYTDEYASS